MQLNVEINSGNDPEHLPITTRTNVLVNGQKMRGVTKVTLVALPNDLWRAEIHVMPSKIDIHGIRTIQLVDEPRLNQPCLGDQYRHYERREQVEMYVPERAEMPNGRQ